MKPLPTVGEAYFMVRQEEALRQGYIPDNLTMAANTFSSPTNQSYSPASIFPTSPQTTIAAVYQPNHKPPSSTRLSSFKKGVFCNYCSKEGHLKSECYKLNGFPTNHPGHPLNRGKFPRGQSQVQDNSRSTNSPNRVMQVMHSSPTESQKGSTSQSDLEQLQHQVQQLMAMMKAKDSPDDHISCQTSGLMTHMAGMISSLSSLQFFVASVQPSHAWIIDSGATDHICNSLHLIHSLITLTFPIQLSLPNGNHVKVHQIGSVFINPLLTLHSVFFVPQFHFNLLSIPKFISHTSYSVQFTKNSCIFQDQHLMKVMATGEMLVPVVST